MGALQGLERDEAAPCATRQGGYRAECLRQHTLKNAIHCSGIGLHSGAKVSMTLKPHVENGGIVFRRVDLEGQPEIPAVWQYAIETPLCTTLAKGAAKVATVEHLMSAFAGCGIDNAIVELNGPEVPIMDGSAAPFVFLIECAGTLEQERNRKAIRILKPIAVEEEHRAAYLTPATGFSIDFEIDFDSAVVSRQEWTGRLTRQQFKCAISRARTFGFLHEVDRLREQGLARGGSLDNAVVISKDGVMNEGGLRFDDEFVRHKVLDSLGDLYLAGAPIIGRFRGIKAGHALNLRLLVALFADSEAWCWSDITPAEAGLSEPDGSSVPPVRAVAARA